MITMIVSGAGYRGTDILNKESFIGRCSVSSHCKAGIQQSKVYTSAEQDQPYPQSSDFASRYSNPF